MTPEAIRRQCLAEGYSAPLINTLYTCAKTSAFPFVLIEEIGSNLSLIVAEVTPKGLFSLTVGKALNFLAEAVILEGMADRHMIFSGDSSLISKVVTGPLSGVYIGAMRSDASTFEAFSMWSPKVTVGGQIIVFQHDHAETSIFREHIIATQNFAHAKFSSLFFGPDFLSLKRSL